MTRLQISCHNPVQAHQQIAAQIWPLLKSHLMAGQRMVLELRQEKRSDAENRMLHAMLDYISKHVEWAGRKRDAETWKRLLVAAWLRARGESIEVLPALDGHGVDVVFRRTSSLTRKECAELIEFIFAWGAQQGIEIPDKSSTWAGIVDEETGEVIA